MSDQPEIKITISDEGSGPEPSPGADPSISGTASGTEGVNPASENFSRSADKFVVSIDELRKDLAGMAQKLGVSVEELVRATGLRVPPESLHEAVSPAPPSPDAGSSVSSAENAPVSGVRNVDLRSVQSAEINIKNAALNVENVESDGAEEKPPRKASEATSSSRTGSSDSLLEIFGRIRDFLSDWVNRLFKGVRAPKILKRSPRLLGALSRGKKFFGAIGRGIRSVARAGGRAWSALSRTRVGSLISRAGRGLSATGRHVGSALSRAARYTSNAVRSTSRVVAGGVRLAAGGIRRVARGTRKAAGAVTKGLGAAVRGLGGVAGALGRGVAVAGGAVASGALVAGTAVVAGFTALASAAMTVKGALDAMGEKVNELTERYAQYSGTVAAASANAQMVRMQREMRIAGVLGEDISKAQGRQLVVEGAQSELEMTWNKLFLRLDEAASPLKALYVGAMKVITYILDKVGPVIVDFVNWVSTRAMEIVLNGIYYVEQIWVYVRNFFDEEQWKKDKADVERRHQERMQVLGNILKEMKEQNGNKQVPLPSLESIFGPMGTAGGVIPAAMFADVPVPSPKNPYIEGDIFRDAGEALPRFAF